VASAKRKKLFYWLFKKQSTCRQQNINPGKKNKIEKYRCPNMHPEACRIPNLGIYRSTQIIKDKIAVPIALYGD
jgi:hypothetical protein